MPLEKFKARPGIDPKGRPSGVTTTLSLKKVAISARREHVVRSGT